MYIARSLAALVLTGSVAAVSAQTKWDLPAAYPAGNPHTQNLNQFAADVAKATGGRLAITVHPNGALFKAPEIKRAVQTGQAQIGEVLMSLLENENPVFGVDSVPFVATSFDASYKLWQAQRPVVEKVLAAQGIRLLYAVAWPPQGIYTKKMLNSTSDMKGLKWRAYNPATTRIAQLVGAQPLTIQAVMTAMERSVDRAVRERVESRERPTPRPTTDRCQKSHRATQMVGSQRSIEDLARSAPDALFSSVDLAPLYFLKNQNLLPGRS